MADKPADKSKGSEPGPKAKSAVDLKKEAAGLKVVDGDKQEGKKETAKPREAIAGDNQLTADQQQALFLNHVGKLAPLIAAKDKAVADLRNFYKMAKAEGSSKERLDKALDLLKDKGEERMRADLEESLEVARMMGASVGWQAEMFPDRRPAVDKAKDDGKIAGLKGLPRKPPFAPELPQYAAWMAGFDEGQKVLVMKLAPPKPPEQPTAKPPAANGAPAPEKTGDAQAAAPKAPAPPPEGGKASVAGGIVQEPDPKTAH